MKVDHITVSDLQSHDGEDDCYPRECFGDFYRIAAARYLPRAVHERLTWLAFRLMKDAAS